MARTQKANGIIYGIKTLLDNARYEDMFGYFYINSASDHMLI